MKKFDLIVIGSGSGLNVASFAAQKGMEVAVVDPTPMGGTCLNRGCIPSKMLIESAEVAQIVKNSAAFGVESQIKKIDFSSIMEETMGFVGEEAKGIEEAIRKHPQYTLFKAYGRFTSSKTLQVGDEEIEGGKVVIAAGTRPFVPEIKGLDGVNYHTSTAIFDIRKQPKHIIFLGGGYISAEMAHFFGSLGTKITVINRSETLLSHEDEEVSRAFADSFGKRYEVLLNTDVSEVSSSNRSIEVKVSKEGKAEVVKGDLLFIATGRVPNTDSLECAKVGYELTKKGYMKVNEYMETSVSGVWALGDIVGKAPFKHGSNYEAKLVMVNALTDKKEKADYSIMPHAVFSSPQIAGVGLMEQEAREKGLDYTVGRYDYIKTGMGKALKDEEGFVKVIADRKSKRMVGAHILGTDASVLIHELIVALKAGGGDLGAIKDVIHIHPALSEVVQRAVNSISFEGPPSRPGKTLMERTTEQKIA